MNEGSIFAENWTIDNISLCIQVFFRWFEIFSLKSIPEEEEWLELALSIFYVIYSILLVVDPSFESIKRHDDQFLKEHLADSRRATRPPIKICLLFSSPDWGALREHWSNRTTLICCKEYNRSADDTIFIESVVILKKRGFLVLVAQSTNFETSRHRWVNTSSWTICCNCGNQLNCADI